MIPLTPAEWAAVVHRDLQGGSHSKDCRACLSYLTRAFEAAIRAERDRLLTALEAAHPPHAPVEVSCIACEALYR